MINIYIILGISCFILFIIISLILIYLYNRSLETIDFDNNFEFADFIYDESQDIFYSDIDSWQRNFGYSRLYDDLAFLFGMIIDSEPIKFEYGGKHWLIEFWKGQYGLTTGAEVGVYTKDIDSPINNYSFYNSASNDDMLPISFNLEKNNVSIISRDYKHWWVTGFRLGEFSSPRELSMYITITLKDISMCTAFVNALELCGYIENYQFTVVDTTVYITFNRPHTPKPITRIAFIDWLVLKRLKKLCKIYRELVGESTNTIDNIKAIRAKKPRIYKRIVNMGKPRKLFNIRVKMSVSKRLSKVFKNSKIISFSDSSKIILMSDCHRGDGTWADTFSKNQNIFYAALNHYYDNDYTYIELGDGDELWENRSPKDIINEHGEVFWLISQFKSKNRLHLIYGNHDICKRKCIPEGLILHHETTGQKIFLVHGHQGDFINDNIWRISRFLVRYLWRHLEILGIKDPTSTAKNYIKKDILEKKIISWVKENNQMLIAGHTHRPAFPSPDEPPYFNDGSCVHPRGITGIEINNGEISLVKWSVKANKSGGLFVGKDILEGPNKLIDYL